MSHYDATKLMGEVLVRSYDRSFGLDATVVRTGFVYGPGRGSGSISCPGRCAARRSEPAGADHPCDFTYVADLAEGLFRAHTTRPLAHRLFNVTGGVLRTRGDLAAAVRAAVPGAAIALGPGVDPGRHLRGACDVTRARTPSWATSRPTPWRRVSPPGRLRCARRGRKRRSPSPSQAGPRRVGRIVRTPGAGGVQWRGSGASGIGGSGESDAGSSLLGWTAVWRGDGPGGARPGRSGFFAAATAAGDANERQLGARKRALLGGLGGHVVELDGDRVNLPYLPPGVRWTGVEPNPHMHPHLRAKAARLGRALDLRAGTAERTGLPCGLRATLWAATLVLCSVEDVRAVWPRRGAWPRPVLTVRFPRARRCPLAGTRWGRSRGWCPWRGGSSPGSAATRIGRRGRTLTHVLGSAAVHHAALPDRPAPALRLPLPGHRRHGRRLSSGRRRSWETVLRPRGAGSGPIVACVGAYTDRGKGIHLFHMDLGSGALCRGCSGRPAHPSSLAFDPAGRYLYAVNEVSNFGGRRRGRSGPGRGPGQRRPAASTG